ncbi:Uncharacterized protein PBTT_09881 [Plasmodiophora brassicae]|uniref:Uncharacterized protein n=1 Tax=Plasmodiophora brassicae TaxID=37360 RepID=A0A0G4J129_PLABS|nr:hypothetical protein PBRA_001934 [Plasmodiophora brassicae]
MSLFDNWVRNAGQYPSQASSAKPVNAASIWGAERVEDQRYTKGHGSAHLVGGQRARPSLFAEAGRTVSTRPLDVCLSATSSSCSTRRSALCAWIMSVRLLQVP